jgi:hypothetical protein
LIQYLLIGVLLAGLLLLLMKWWANTEVASAKRGLMWAIVALCGVFALLLLASGRGVLAILPAGFAAFKMFGPALAGRYFQSKPSFKGKRSSRPSSNDMSEDEALDVLGLEKGATQADITEAYRRLMGQVHPDKGGSDWMAAKLNAAKKTLLD